MAVQYVDYTLWQRAQLGDLGDQPTAASPRSWPTGSRPWPGCPSAWQLPTDRPYPPVADYRGARWRWTGRRSCSSRCAGRPPAQGDQFHGAQAALAVLLSKIGASPEVAVGFPIAGRGDPALEDLVGFFVNTLVLRVDLGGDPTVAELLAQVRSAAWPPTSIKTCPLRCWSSGSTPPEPDPSPADPGDVGLAELRRAGVIHRRDGIG